ncbi:hypothetical protein F5897_001390 [Canibacter oris]|uniref:Uncharacterized protein n=1 Tax=Canibacter oris TaxID=1365628 RepID=A0A840DPN6_9MICO|nr:hypothetical protein [Canibacter oris]
MPQEATEKCDSTAEKSTKSKLRKFFKNHKTDSNEAPESGV